MKEYPQLAEMGITSSRQIEKFMINSILDIDVLRIVYKRRKGSFLPTSRTYKFPRVQKTVVDGKKRQVDVMESHPALLAAVDELHKLLDDKEKKQSVKESILEELALLEEDIALRSACIKELLTRV